MSANPFLKDINKAAETQDHTIEQEFVAREVPAGLTVGRLVEYVS